jgi:hypothetical protein
MNMCHRRTIEQEHHPTVYSTWHIIVHCASNHLQIMDDNHHNWIFNTCECRWCYNRRCYCIAIQIKIREHPNRATYRHTVLFVCMLRCFIWLENAWLPCKWLVFLAMNPRQACLHVLSIDGRLFSFWWSSFVRSMVKK